MDYIWMSAKSWTQAQKMKGVLYRAGIPAELRRSRASAAAMGCGYMLGVEKEARAAALLALRRSGIEPRMLFSESGGDFREAEHDLF